MNLMMILMIRNASFKCTSVINVSFDESDAECSAGCSVTHYLCMKMCFSDRGDKWFSFT